VTSVAPSRRPASRWTSSTDLTTLTPPAFAAAARMDLCLDDPDRAAELARRRHGILDREGRHAARKPATPKSRSTAFA